ncbi:MAG: ATP-binding cassette domain-containing protein [Treponema sp.]|uniref:ATP-binding cassette domain-containing protein n=1 Tax=Treponema sp. TaxID=166 RepID=UPI00298E4FBF|nr:ATP-binding cassette domain-containing protein [Treponema sp.]MBR5933417.1 ATP-binding cassette domain-containing protein [Treponema sp.]
MVKDLITIKDCRVEDLKSVKIENVNWNFKSGEAWLVIGPNGGGKAEFLKALCGQMNIVPLNPLDSVYSNIFEGSVEIVSLEKAARLIEEERINDESEYVEGGVDIGRTGRVFLAEAILGTKVKKNSKLPEEALRLETYPQVKLCGIEKILDRGLKYMSTGEIRRTLLARALISGKKLLILSDPFAGLDVESRKILLDFFDTIAKKQLKETDSMDFPRIILGMERYHEIPDAINNVIEFTQGKVSFSGTRTEYEKIIEKRNEEKDKNRSKDRNEFENDLEQIQHETQVLHTEKDESETLIEMNSVNVGWGDNHVLVDLNWSLKKGQHWLIRGPNGSGKTTFLELITGDNMQVFSNDIKIFGARRGSGETIWDIKRKLGIVSYRLHVEYRMVGSTTLENVIISGFRDSIGLYEAATDVEKAAAKRWLVLGGFKGRESEAFNSISYGEQRAILILRAAVKCPPVLILDEPCHGLDENYRQKILDLLEIVAESGTTTLLHVTHDASEVLDCEKNILEFYPKASPMYRIICR